MERKDDVDIWNSLLGLMDDCVADKEYAKSEDADNRLQDLVNQVKESK